jgi:hypothetical protein
MPTNNRGRIKRFAIKDCAPIAIATVIRAQNFRKLIERLSVHPGCIYYYLWRGLLRPKFTDPEYNNDFAAWAFHRLHIYRYPNLVRACS